MITLHIVTQQNIVDVTQWQEGGSITWSELGDESVQITVPNIPQMRQIVQSAPGNSVVAYDSGREIWRGRLHAASQSADTIELTALGDIYRFEDRQDYSAFWSHVGTAGWNQVSSAEILNGFNYDGLGQPVSTVTGIRNEAFTIDFSNRVYITYRNNASIPNNMGAAVVFELPYSSENGIRQIQYYARQRLPTGWILRVRGLNEINEVTDNFSNFAGNNNIQLAGAAGPNRPVSRKLLIQVLNETGGTYTNTQPDGHWFVELLNWRLLATSQDSVSYSLVGNTVAGSGILFTPSNIDGIYPGSIVTFASGNTETLQVLSVSGTTFRADAERTHANGDTLFVSRLRTSTIISGIAATALGSSLNSVIEQTSDDVPNALYNNTTPLKVIQALANEGDGNRQCNISCRSGVFLFQPIVNTTLYYLDQAEITFTKDVDNYTSHIRADYTSFAGFDRTTPYVTSLNVLPIERRRRVETSVTNRPQATGIAGVILGRQSQQVLRMVPKGGVLYNQFGGRVQFPRTNTAVILKNIIPEIYGLNGTYYLEKLVYSFDTREWEYVIDIEEETFTRLLAGK